ncbi:hypothetical protein Tco_0980659 [Tanacetum coccineum]
MDNCFLCHSKNGDSFTYDSTLNSFDNPPDFSYPPPQPQYVPYSCELCGNDAHYGYDCPPQVPFDRIFGEISILVRLASTRLLRKLLKDVQNVKEELAEDINTPNWDRPAFYYDDDDDDDDEESYIPLRDIIIFGLPWCIAITPVLSIEEPVDSLIMEDEHLDTILATESDEVIKSSVEDLISIPSESEGIPDNMCDVPFRDRYLRLLKFQRSNYAFFESNDDSTSIDDDSFSIDNIDYVEASPPHSELVSLEEVKDFHPKDRELEDDVLHEKLSKINLLIAKIEALKDNPTPSSDFIFGKEKSSGNPTSYTDLSLPDYEAFFCDSKPDSGDFTMGSFVIKSPIPSSDWYHLIISLPDLECVYFKSEPDPEDLTSTEPRIRENVSSTKNVNLPFEDDQSPLFAYVVWIFLSFLTYPVAPPYLLSFGNEYNFDGPASPFIIIMPSVSHRSVTFMKFNVIQTT